MEYLTKADLIALNEKESEHFFSKGLKYYKEENYELAHLYFSTATNLGSTDAMVYLAKIYLEGLLDNNPNLDLAYSLLRLSALQNHPEAIYQLGRFSSLGLVVDQDKESAIYYYTKAIKVLDYNNIDYPYYPSLMMALAVEKMDGGYFTLDIYGAYMLLIDAKLGFDKLIKDGEVNYKEEYDKVILLLEDPLFDIMCRNYEEYQALEYRFSESPTEIIDSDKLNGAKVRLKVDYNPTHFIYNEIMSEEIDEIKKGSIGTIVSHYAKDQYMVEFKNENNEVIAKMVIAYDDFELVTNEEETVVI